MPNSLIFKSSPYRDGSPEVVSRIIENNICIAAQHSNRDQGYVGAHVYEQERGFSFVPFREGAEPEVRGDLKLYGTAWLTEQDEIDRRVSEAMGVFYRSDQTMCDECMEHAHCICPEGGGVHNICYACYEKEMIEEITAEVKADSVTFTDGTTAPIIDGIIRDAVGNAVLFAVGGIFILLLLS